MISFDLSKEEQNFYLQKFNLIHQLIVLFVTKENKVSFIKQQKIHYTTLYLKKQINLIFPGVVVKNLINLILLRKIFV